MNENYTPPAAALKDEQGPGKSRYVHVSVAAASAFVTLPIIVVVVAAISHSDPARLQVVRVLIASSITALLVGASLLPIRYMPWYLAIPIGAVLCPVYVTALAYILSNLIAQH